MGDFGIMSFMSGLAQNVVSNGLGIIVNNARDTAIGNMSTEGRIAEKIRSTIQSDIENIKERQTSQAEYKISMARQLISEAVIGRHTTFDAKQISLIYLFRNVIPYDRKWMLSEADLKAKEAFHDTKNASPLLRVEALNIQQFCQVQLHKDDHQRCLSLIVLQIQLIKRDNDMNEVLSKTVAKQIRATGSVHTAVVQLYQNVRYGLCIFGASWKEKGDLQRAIDALNEIRPEPTFERIRKNIGVDGLLLSTICRGRAIVLAVGSLFYHNPTDKRLFVFNCPHNALEIDMSSLSVIKKTKGSFLSNYFKQKSGMITCSNPAKNQRMMTEKNHVVSKIDTGLFIEWFGDKNTSKHDLTDFLIQQTDLKQPETVPQDFVSTKIVLINVKDATQSETIMVVLEVKIKEMEQKLCLVKCSKNGTTSTEILFQLDLPEPHSVYWSTKSNCYEAIFVNKDDRSLITVVQMNSNKITAMITGVKLVKMDDFDLIPKSVVQNIPRKSNSNNQKYSFAVNQFFITDQFIFVALAINQSN